jgi:hypothetical protein
MCRFSDKAVEGLVLQAGSHFASACSTSCGIEVSELLLHWSLMSDDESSLQLSLGIA